MYIVRRSFRGPNGPLTAGSVVEPADMKDFRYRLQQKHVVEVTEHNFERYQSLFKQRFGIEIPALVQPVDKVKAEAEEKAKAEAEEKVKVKPVTTATVRTAKAVTTNK